MLVTPSPIFPVSDALVVSAFNHIYHHPSSTIYPSLSTLTIHHQHRKNNTISPLSSLSSPLLFIFYLLLPPGYKACTLLGVHRCTEHHQSHQQSSTRNTRMRRKHPPTLCTSAKFHMGNERERRDARSGGAQQGIRRANSNKQKRRNEIKGGTQVTLHES